MSGLQNSQYHVKITNSLMVYVGLIGIFWSIGMIVQFWLIGLNNFEEWSHLPAALITAYVGYRQGLEVTKVGKNDRIVWGYDDRY